MTAEKPKDGAPAEPPQQRRQPDTATSLITRMARDRGVDPGKLMSTLKATAFRQRADRDGRVREVSDEELMALLMIAEKYGLDPFTKEIFAFFDSKSGAIVPVVSVDGWSRIINAQPQCRGITFTYGPLLEAKHKSHPVHEWIECSIRRSDRDDPVTVREYFDEVVRDVSFSTPWDTHPKRMHRHKALIQCGRLAFGFAGIHDADEAERIIEGEAARVPETSQAAADINAQAKAAQPALEHQPLVKVPQQFTSAAEATPVETTKAAEPKRKSTAKAEEPAPPTFAELAHDMNEADDEGDCDLVLDMGRHLPEEQFRDLMNVREQRITSLRAPNQKGA
jgi:phage recombination protein Bet